MHILSDQIINTENHNASIVFNIAELHRSTQLQHMNLISFSAYTLKYHASIEQGCGYSRCGLDVQKKWSGQNLTTLTACCSLKKASLFLRIFN